MLSFKICVVGAFGVGKTSLVRRYAHSIFDERYFTTVGVRVDQKEIHVGANAVQLVLWDIAGEDEVTKLRMQHLRGMSGYLLVADGLRADTVATAKRLRADIDRTYPSVPFLLLINKSDLRHDWEVSPASIQDLQDQGWDLMETSAKRNEGVELAFMRLASRLLA
jgi:small GTP-binding protein